jgi:uncharacterized LabA/DUF88 family protein
MKRNLIQFDGSNFYNKVKKLLPQIHLTNYNYADLAKFISKSTQNTINYYVGEVKKYQGNHKSEQLYSHQQALFTHLRKQGITIKLGYLLLSNNVYHEKGVDVEIAVDITKGAIKNEYDTVYLISSDTDLLPAIQVAKQEKKEVVYVGFENAKSIAMSRHCTSYIILKREDILKFA